MCQFVIKSFGYGIIMIEPVGQSTCESKVMKERVFSMFQNVQGWIELPKENKAIFMIEEGHATTKYELALLEQEDWELIQEAVKKFGSESFQIRLFMLGKHVIDSLVEHHI